MALLGRLTSMFLIQLLIISIIYSISQQLLQSGFRHQNLNANNLCYLKKDQFIITDYEEVDSIYQVPDSLDVDTQSMPLYHRIYLFQYLNKGQWNGQDVEEFLIMILLQRGCFFFFNIMLD